MAKPRPEKKPEPAAPGTTRILPIQLQLGDRVTDATGEWEVSSGNLWLGFRLTRPGQSSRNPRKCFRPDVAASLLPGGFSHGQWRSAGTPKQYGEEHLNKPLHPHIPERTAIIVQPKLDGERPPSDRS